MDPKDTEITDSALRGAEAGTDDEALLLLHLDELESPSPQLRVHAARALRRLKDKRAVPRLIEALGDSHPDVRFAVAEALGWLRDERAVSALADALRRDRSHAVRQTAAEALGQIGDVHAVPGLIRAMRDSDIGVRICAIQALGLRIRKQDVRAVPMLIEVSLYDPDAEVRRVAVHALGKIGDIRAIPTLIYILDNMDENQTHQVAEAALAELGEQPLGNFAVLTDLVAALAHGRALVRWVAAVALGLMGEARAAPHLIALLYDIDYQVRQAAAEALGRIGDLRALPHLMATLYDRDTDVRVATGEALGRLGRVGVAPGLLEALRDESSRVRAGAALALGAAAARLPDDAVLCGLAVSRLVDALGDGDFGVRRAVAEALGKIGAHLGAADRRTGALRARVAPALIDRLDDDSNLVRLAATEALGRVRDERAVPRLAAQLRKAGRIKVAMFQRTAQVVAEALEQIGTAEALAAVAMWREAQ
ncbi:MAG: HEAT repeat domain-containing protein [Anaerolineae bacterium]|nr:HEAT repeat domain-containing protein [Anaerolineae bacterium]